MWWFGGFGARPRSGPGCPRSGRGRPLDRRGFSTARGGFSTGYQHERVFGSRGGARSRAQPLRGRYGIAAVASRVPTVPTPKPPRVATAPNVLPPERKAVSSAKDCRMDGASGPDRARSSVALRETPGRPAGVGHRGSIWPPNVPWEIQVAESWSRPGAIRASEAVRFIIGSWRTSASGR